MEKYYRQNFKQERGVSQSWSYFKKLFLKLNNVLEIEFEIDTQFMPVARSNLLLRFSEHFLRILLSEFRFTVFIPGVVEWIHKSPTAIFSQPIFFTNIWTAFFEEKNITGKAPEVEVYKCREVEEQIAEMSCVHFTRLLDLLWHYLKKFQEIRILRKTFQESRLFSRANLILRPALGHWS